MLAFLGIFVAYLLLTLIYVVACQPFTLGQSDDSRSVDPLPKEYIENNTVRQVSRVS